MTDKTDQKVFDFLKTESKLNRNKNSKWVNSLEVDYEYTDPEVLYSILVDYILWDMDHKTSEVLINCLRKYAYSHLPEPRK
jgi:hypothetical protein